MLTAINEFKVTSRDLSHLSRKIAELALTTIRNNSAHDYNIETLSRIIGEFISTETQAGHEPSPIEMSQHKKIDNRNKYFNIFSAAATSILIIDRNCTIKELNSYASSIFEVSVENNENCTLANFACKSSMQKIEAAVNNIYSQNLLIESFVILQDIKMLVSKDRQMSGFLSIVLLPQNEDAEVDFHPDLVCVYTETSKLSNLSTCLPRCNNSLLLYEQAFEQISEALMVTELDGIIVSANKSFTEVTGYELSEVLGKSANILSSGITSGDTYRDLWSNLRTLGKWQGELINRRKNGTIYPEWISINTIYNEKNEPWRYVAVFNDLTIQRTHEQALQRRANEDALTGLPNRHVMPILVEQAFERARRAKSKVGLFFIDLDNFKNINDSLGHLAGDEVLVSISTKLVSRLRETDTLIRLGGDEFLVVAENLPHASSASLLAQSLLDVLIDPISLSSGRQLFVSCSIGVGLFPDNGESTEELLQEADTAMYRAKQNGRGRFELFSPGLMSSVKEEFEIASDLRLSIKRDELFFEFQPIVPTCVDMPYELEALVRWNHPIKGVVYPGIFIGIAERMGLLKDISIIALHKSCISLRKMLDAELPIRSVSVNIPISGLESSVLIEQIVHALKSNRLTGDHLKIEITESELMKNVTQAKLTLEAIRSLGVRIAIDDFGTGYSSLSYLNVLPIDTLKVDASFVASIEFDETAKSIVTTIVGLAKSLKLEVVAEGVETIQQVDILKDLKIEYLQGWFFSKSRSESDLIENKLII